MFTRLIVGLKRGYQEHAHGGELPVGFVVPRLWMILLVLTLPFFTICADYFESLERTGILGAVIADTLLPAFMVAYILLLFVLKRRKI